MSLIGIESEAETGLGLCRIHNGARASASRLEHYGAVSRSVVDASNPCTLSFDERPISIDKHGQSTVDDGNLFF